MVADCIFCKIATGEIPAKIILTNEYVTAFHDLNPQAPVHALVIPKQHIGSLAESRDAEATILAALLQAAAAVAAQEGVATGGYRVVINSGADAGQSVAHLHLHVLGGRALAWPPG